MTTEIVEEIGKVTRVAGPVVFATGFNIESKNVMVRIGSDKILGEVVEVREEILVIQAYEETEGVKLGDKVINSNEPFYARLGPGMLGSTYDGLQRPTEKLELEQGPFLDRGTLVDPFDPDVSYYFYPKVKTGETINSGDIIGYVEEKSIKHNILVPQEVTTGKVKSIVNKGEYKSNETLLVMEDGTELGFYQRWQIRKPRPFQERLETYEPLITGQRIIDTLFPVTNGGTSTVSGGFGTGKTILEQTLAKFARVDVIILVLIGERGNEVATVLGEFEELMDETGEPLMDRTVVIANTSNMPVAAREASIFLGMTIAEYFRDLGLDVALLADSMSRWAEAVREISGRLEEMPAEEGYPAYMSKSLGEFFERAGRFKTITGSEGSITYIAAISPPGGDFTEPVTQSALRVTGAFWALNTELARSRHFPAIDWNESFTQYGERVSSEIADKYKHWGRIRKKILTILKREEDLQQTVRLLGRDNLSEQQKGMLDIARFIKNAYLQQDAFDRVDQDCSLDKQYLMLQTIDKIEIWMQRSIEQGNTSAEFFSRKLINRSNRMREIPENELDILENIIDEIEQNIGGKEND